MKQRLCFSRRGWKWKLPLLMIAVTTPLIFLSAIQESKFSATHRYRGTDVPADALRTPARFFVQLLNGPGLLFGPSGGRIHVHAFGVDVYELPRLIGIGLFWAFIGLTLDRKLQGGSGRILKSPLLRGTWFAVLLGLACLFIWSGVSFLGRETFSWGFISAMWRVWGLRSGLFGQFALILWFVGIAAYSGWRLLSVFREEFNGYANTR